MKEISTQRRKKLQRWGKVQKYHFRDTDWKGKSGGSIKPETVEPSKHVAYLE